MEQDNQESVSERITRLNITNISEKRLASLSLSHSLVEDAVFLKLASATRLSRKTSIVLPSHRFEGLSRGKGWARKGRGDKAEWGERDGNGYIVGPGRWVVGGHDGFSRKGEDTWEVTHVQVGKETWTVAD